MATIELIKGGLKGSMEQQTSDSGNPYFHIEIEGRAYIGVVNTAKTEEGQPDFLICEAKDGIDDITARASDAWLKLQ